METAPLKVLTSWREREGLNKAQAAARVNVPRGTWLRWETGVRPIGVKSLPKVQEITGIPANELRPDLAQVMGEAAA